MRRLGQHSPGAGWRRLARALLIVGPLSLLSAPAQPQSQVDLAIVGSLDRSQSIDSVDAMTQIQGLIYTLRHSRFRDLVANGPHGRIGLAVLTWSSFGHHQVILPWTAIAGPGDADRAAALLAEDYQRQASASHGSLTDIDLAIEAGVLLLEVLPWRASQRVINVVADGVGNIRRPSAINRDAAVALGITINGLIMAEGAAVETLSEFFRREVIGGPTAFLQVSATNLDFAAAMLRKVLREIVRLRVPHRPPGPSNEAINDLG